MSNVTERMRYALAVRECNQIFADKRVHARPDDCTIGVYKGEGTPVRGHRVFLIDEGKHASLPWTRIVDDGKLGKWFDLLDEGELVSFIRTDRGNLLRRLAGKP